MALIKRWPYEGTCGSLTRSQHYMRPKVKFFRVVGKLVMVFPSALEARRYCHCQAIQGAHWQFWRFVWCARYKK